MVFADALLRSGLSHDCYVNGVFRLALTEVRSVRDESASAFSHHPLLQAYAHANVYRTKKLRMQQGSSPSSKHGTANGESSMRRNPVMRDKLVWPGGSASGYNKHIPLMPLPVAAAPNLFLSIPLSCARPATASLNLQETSQLHHVTFVNGIAASRAHQVSAHSPSFSSK